MERLEVHGAMALLMYEIMSKGAFDMNLESLIASLNDVLVDMGEAERFEAFIIDGADPGELAVQLRDRPAVDRLAEVGAAYRAKAALERGVRDGQRLLDGELTTEELAEELSADPP